MKSQTRIAVATGLTVVAIAVPSAAWYVAGTGAALREATRIRNVARLTASQVAVGLAERLSGRLEGMRDTESRRPPYHYEVHFHDPTSDCACASITPSPLARGPGDPLIWTHLQIDALGRLTLPTYPRPSLDGEAEAVDVAWMAAQREIHATLLPLAQALQAEAPEAPSAGTADRDGGNLTPPPMRAGDAAAAAAEELASDAWRTLLLENEKPVVGPFEWRTIAIGDHPSLVALRSVSTSRGTVVQGFVVSTQDVDESLKGAFYPAGFVPGDSLSPGRASSSTPWTSARTRPPDDGADATVRAPVALPGSQWLVKLDAGEAMERARLEGEAVLSRFHRTFLWVAAAAALAGVSVLGLVWQTDRLSRQRSTFAASAAHELRTPLAGIRVYADMLAEGLGDPAQTERYARHVAAESERLGRVVSNVLGYTRLERGTLQVRPEPGDIADAVRECVERLRGALEAAGARIDLVIDSALPGLRFDRDALFHIVQNLLDNAERYARDASDRTIHVRLSPDGKGVALSVADHGPGIPSDRVSGLFRPFRRGGDRDAPPGLGLGLTLVRGLATAHEGTVSYRDAPGAGAVFTVRLPG